MAVILPASRPAEGRRKKWLRKGADLRQPEKSRGLQAGDARISIVAAQPAGFGEFGGGAFGVAFKGIGGGEPGMVLRECRIGVARFFEPGNRLVDARLQQMRLPDPANTIMPIRGSRGLRRMACSWSGIASSIDPVRTCTGRAGLCEQPVAIERERPSRIREWPPRIGSVRAAAGLWRNALAGARRCRQGLPGQLLRAFDIGGAESVIHSSTRPASTGANQLCASMDCGSSANACSNKLIASA